MNQLTLQMAGDLKEWERRTSTPWFPRLAISELIVTGSCIGYTDGAM